MRNGWPTIDVQYVVSRTTVPPDCMCFFANFIGDVILCRGRNNTGKVHFFLSWAGVGERSLFAHLLGR